MLQTDIADCYGSIYTHSIPWAIHSKAEAKKQANRADKTLIGNSIDNYLQDMSYGQTNGIPQGSNLMDFIAEIVLGYVDYLLTEKIKNLAIIDYCILRYRDDYRIFSNNPFEAELITKALSEVLSDMGLKLNAEKTHASNDVITNAIKPDKRYWIVNKRITENKQKWLIQLHLLSGQFPNSGTLYTQMKEFLEVLQKSERKDLNLPTLISLVVEIAYRNPRVIPLAVNILTHLLNQLQHEKEKQSLVKRMKAKFDRIPNSGLLKVWLQRLYLKIDTSITYEEKLCQKVLFRETQIWNSHWLDTSLKDAINKAEIIDYHAVENLKPVATDEEMELLFRPSGYFV